MSNVAITIGFDTLTGRKLAFSRAAGVVRPLRLGRSRRRGWSSGHGSWRNGSLITAPGEAGMTLRERLKGICSSIILMPATVSTPLAVEPSLAIFVTALLMLGPVGCARWCCQRDTR